MTTLIERLELGPVYKDDPEYPTTKSVCDYFATEKLMDEAAAEITRLQAITKEYADALNRSPYDIGPCLSCNQAVVCIPDGMPMCDPCGEKEAAKEATDA